MAIDDTPDTPAPEAAPQPTRRRTPAARKKAAPAPEANAHEATPESAHAEPRPKAPARRRRAKPSEAGPATQPVAEPLAEPLAEPVPEPPAEPAPAPKSRSRRRATPAADALPPEALKPSVVAEPPAPEPPAPVPPPEPPAPPVHAAIALGDGRVPVFIAGRDTPEATLQRLTRWQDEDAALRLPDADALSRLLDELGVRVDVDEAVWALLARRGDLQQRIDHLSALYPQGLDAVDLPAAAGLRACQREGAFYAACVGHCALADEAALAPEQQLALAWQLVQRHFGAQRLALQAPADAVADWATLLGTEPTLDATTADVLLIDARAGLPPLSALPATTWLWLLAPPALLDDPAASAWLDALDRTATGAVAAWQAQRDEQALAPLLLRRRFADVADQWPAWAPQTLPVRPSDDEAAQQASLLSAMREGLARWQRSGFLSDSEQLALLRQRRGLESLARAAAAGALVPAVQRALAEGAQRVLVFTADADLAGPLAEVLQGEYLPAQALPAGDDTDHWLRAWRDAEGPRVLVLADEADAPRIATHPHRPAVVLLDGAADEALRTTRLTRVRWPRHLREAPVWQMAAPDTPALPPAPAQGLLRGAALSAWLAAVQPVLLQAPSVASEPAAA